MSIKKFLGNVTGFKLALAITIVFAPLHYFYSENIPLLKGFELKTLDMRFKIRGKIPLTEDVVIVVIDDYSIENLGRWPWPRTYHAECLNKLSADGARVIGLDLIFSDPEESPESYKLESLKKYFDALKMEEESVNGVRFSKMLSMMLEASDNDVEFGKAISRNNNVGQGLVFEYFTEINGKPVVYEMPSEETLPEEVGRDDEEEVEEEVPDNDMPPAELLEETQEDNDMPPAELLEEMPEDNDMPPAELLEETSGDNDMPPVELLKEVSGDNDMPPAELLEETSGDSDMPPDDLLQEASDGNDMLEGEPPIEVPEIMKTIALKQLSGSSDIHNLKVPVAKDVLLPLPELYQGARSLGFLNIFPDSDGVIRWDTLLIKYNGNYYPSFALQLLKQYYGLKNEDIKLEWDKGLLLGDIIIPVDKYGRMFMNHYGPAYMVKYYSYADVVFGDLPQGTFKDKIVLIGAAATGLGDTWPTPFAHEAFPGVEKHAVVMNNILQKNFIYKNEFTLLYELLFIAVIGLGVGYFLTKFSPVKAVLFIVFALALILLSNYAMFYYLKMWINLVNPMFQFIVVASTVITFKFFTEDKQKRFIKGAFGQYLSPAIIENLVNNPDMLKLGGERKVLTAFFSDVAGFSTISEKLTPEELVDLLNNYLTEMSDIILGYGGTIDKYEGDAIIAFFGAPLTDEEHAKKACMVSVEMQQRLEKMRVGWREEGKNELYMRIGLNTGPMVVGNMGSKTRMDYTMMGDSVNLAARLEGVNKQYGTFTMISEYTLKEIGDDFEVRELDSIRVMGKKEPVKIYELIARKGDISNDKREVIQLFLQGLEAYRKQEWQEAITFFEKALKVDKDDKPSETLLKRCEGFLASPPHDNWDGIYDMKTK